MGAHAAGTPGDRERDDPGLEQSDGWARTARTLERNQASVSAGGVLMNCPGVLWGMSAALTTNFVGDLLN